MANENASARGRGATGGGERRGREDRRGRDNAAREEKSQYLERVDRAYEGYVRCYPDGITA